MKFSQTFLYLLAELTRLKLTLFVVLSSATGFVLSRQGISLQALPILLAVFLLASGASALNQYQERKEDSRMERTKGRPIPSGRLSPPSALFISLLLLLFGFILLTHLDKPETFGLGLLAVAIYNGVYTPLKKRTYLSVLPGALVGALPPAMGWISGGGTLEPQLLVLFTFFFLWQVPHTWLLLLEYRKDYLRAGFAHLLLRGECKGAESILWVWIVATVVCSLLIPLFNDDPSLGNLVGLFSLGLLTTLRTSRKLLSGISKDSLRFTSRAFKLYIISVMVLLNLNRIMKIG